MRPEVGDKVRLKATAELGGRGVIESVDHDSLVVRLANAERISVSPRDLTNFSLAARKAWRNMPDRRVGRPKGSRICDRLSVTLRIDRELWESFRRLEASGAVSDRTACINELLRDKLAELEIAGRGQNGKKG